MENFDNKKREFSDLERQQTKLHVQYLEQRRKRFDYADTAQWILEDKNQSDLIYLGEKLSEWSGKAKEGNKKQFEDLIVTLFGVQSYCTNLENLCKQSVSLYATERKTNERLQSELRLLKLESDSKIMKLEKLVQDGKKELEFINKTSKP